MPLPISSQRLQRRRAFFHRLWIYGYASAGIIAVIGGLYVLIASPFFKISELVITGIDTGTQSELLTALKQQIAAKPLGGLLGADHYASWPDHTTLTAPPVRSATISKDFWARRVTITAVPRTRFAIWCVDTQNECQWIDSDGTAFATAGAAQGQLVPTIHEDGDSITELGTRVLPDGAFIAIKKIIAGLSEAGIATNGTVFYQETQELHITTETGTLLIFSTRFDPATTALPAVRTLAKNPGLTKIVYINLASQNRAAVKYR